MKFAKKGDYRIKCMIDWEGDYVASVQVYRGFWSGWTNQRSFYAMSRSAEEALALARKYLAERAVPLVLGVVK